MGNVHVCHDFEMLSRKKLPIGGIYGDCVSAWPKHGQTMLTAQHEN